MEHQDLRKEYLAFGILLQMVPTVRSQIYRSFSQNGLRGRYIFSVSKQGKKFIIYPFR